MRKEGLPLSRAAKRAGTTPAAVLRHAGPALEREHGRYRADQLGSVSELTSSAGATEWTYAYEPFGSIRTETQNDPSAPTNPVRFTSEYLDPTGLYYLRARQYDPSIGRFLQTDPGVHVQN